MKDLKDAGLSGNEAQELERALKQADPVAGRGNIMKYGGISSYLRYLFRQDTEVLKGSLVLTITGGACDILTIFCVVLIANFIAAFFAATDDWTDMVIIGIGVA